MANNPVRYTDPTGHKYDPGGESFNSRYRLQTPIPKTRPNVATNSAFLDGGPGTITNYSSAAQESWTGFSGSGESSNIGLAGLANTPDLINNFAVLARDNTNIRGYFNNPEISGNVYYELTNSGWQITGASISNSTYEEVGITYISADSYNLYTNNLVLRQRLFIHLNTQQYNRQTTMLLNQAQLRIL